jgi:hypothetical protein
MFKEKCHLCDKLLKVDVVLTSFKSMRCILIEQDVHLFRGKTSRITNWENVCPIEEQNPSGKFLLFSELFKSKLGSSNNKHNYINPIPYFTNSRNNILLFDIGEQLVVARDYHKLKDELVGKNDEIQVLKEELKSAKGLITCQANRLVITSSPIIEKQPTRKADLKPKVVDASQDNKLPETQVISYYKLPYIYHSNNYKMLTKQDVQNEAISDNVTLKSQDNIKRKKRGKRNEVSLFRNKTNHFGYSFKIQYMSYRLELMIEVKRKGKRNR